MTAQREATCITTVKSGVHIKKGRQTMKNLFVIALILFLPLVSFAQMRTIGDYYDPIDSALKIQQIEAQRLQNQLLMEQLRQERQRQENSTNSMQKTSLPVVEMKCVHECAQPIANLTSEAYQGCIDKCSH